MSFSISEITIAHEKTLLGLDIKKPSIAWKYKSEEKSMKQRSVRIFVGTLSQSSDMWDSGI